LYNYYSVNVTRYIRGKSLYAQTYKYMQ